MTHLNNQVISCPEKKAIAETVHETLSEFRDELKGLVDSGYAGYTDILEGSCFYYAALGAEVCTKFYQQSFNDTVSSYTMDAGYFALRPYKDKTQKSEWFIYSGEISNNRNNYHCWIYSQSITVKHHRKPEIIDFTARHYKAQVDKKADLNWEREDLEGENFIWTNDFDDLEFNRGLLFRARENTIKFVLNKWKNDSIKNDSLPKRMMKKSEEILNCKLASLSNEAQS